MLEGTWRSWSPWKIVTIASAVVVTTALVAGLVVANWTGRPVSAPDPVMAPPPPAMSRALSQAQTHPAGTAPRVASRPNSTDVLQKALIGGALGAGVGAASGAIAGGGKDAGKGAAIGGIVGATAGTLYGLTDKR